MFEKGDKVRIPTGKVVEIDWELNDRVGTSAGVFDITEIKLIQRQLYTTRLTKSIEDMNPEELRTFLSQQFTRRNLAMVNSLEKIHAKRGAGKGTKSTKRATAKPLVDHFTKLGQIDGVSPELIESIKRRLQGGSADVGKGVQEKVESNPVV